MHGPEPRRAKDRIGSHACPEDGTAEDGWASSQPGTGQFYLAQGVSFLVRERVEEWPGIQEERGSVLVVLPVATPRDDGHLRVIRVQRDLPRPGHVGMSSESKSNFFFLHDKPELTRELSELRLVDWFLEVREASFQELPGQGMNGCFHVQLEQACQQRSAQSCQQSVIVWFNH